MAAPLVEPRQEVQEDAPLVEDPPVEDRQEDALEPRQEALEAVSPVDDLGLTPHERERLGQLTEKVRERVVRDLETKDPILVKDAKDRLRPAALPSKEPPPQTTVELIRRVHERREWVPALASILQRDLKDTSPKQWNLWLSVANRLAMRAVEAAAVVRLYEYAMNVGKPGNYFARGWSRLLDYA